MSMNHKKIVTFLESFVLGRLAPDQAEAVESHLKKCSSCSAEVEELRQLADGVRQYCDRLSEAPPGLWRERLRQGWLPPQQADASSERTERTESSWRKGFRIRFRPLLMRPAVILASFLLGMAAQHLFVVRWLQGLPSAFASKEVFVLLGQKRSRTADEIPPIEGDIEMLDFRMAFDRTSISQVDCRLVRSEGAQSQLIAEKRVVVVNQHASISVPVKALRSGRYEMLCAEEGVGERHSGSFELRFQDRVP